MDGLRPMSGITLPSPSPRSARFSQEYDIAPRRPRNKVPTSLKAWAVGGTVLMMLVLAAAIEVALHFSNKNQGFPMGHLSTDAVQWLSSFIPVLAIGPIVWIWIQSDKDLKRLQPYVNLSRGPARAEESVLMDLEHDKTPGRALQNGHFLIIGSSLIVLVNVLLQPLAGAFFLVKPGAITGSSDIPVRSKAAIGLNPSNDLTSFVGAAGYAQAAAMYNLSDPPFVLGGWAIAPFEFPLDVTRNSTLSIPTVGIYTNVSCTAFKAIMTPPTAPTSLNWTLVASLPGISPGCNASQSIDSSVSELQYGVDVLPGCSMGNAGTLAARDPQALDPFLQPLFWFASIPRSLAAPKNETTRRDVTANVSGSAVFCAPKITTHLVEALADGVTGLLLSVNVTGDVGPSSNNLTGGDLPGNAFNGLFFDADPFNLTDPYVNARAQAVQSGIPGSIFNLASDPNHDGGLDAIFSDTTGFVGPTEKIYSQYLSLVALSNYFVPTEKSLAASVTRLSNRLWISPLSAHLVSSLLVLVAVSGTIIHVSHSRQRKRLYLASHPGSMAHYLSMLSRPRLTFPIAKDGVSENVVLGLGPLDDEKIMQDKLKGLLFVMDERSGVIFPVSAGESWVAQSRRVSWRGSSAYELEDPRRALLSPSFHAEGS